MRRTMLIKIDTITSSRTVKLLDKMENLRSHLDALKGKMNHHYRC